MKTLVILAFLAGYITANRNLLKSSQSYASINKPCVVKGCACLNSSLANSTNITCPSPAIEKCFVNYSDTCLIQKDGKCAFDPALRSLTTCVNNNQICRREGCDPKKCIRNTGISNVTVCLNPTTHVECYDNTPCLINGKGECEYDGKWSLAWCLFKHFSPLSAYKF